MSEKFRYLIVCRTTRNLMVRGGKWHTDEVEATRVALNMAKKKKYPTGEYKLVRQYENQTLKELNINH